MATVTTDPSTDVFNLTTVAQWTDQAPSPQSQTVMLIWKIWAPCILVLGTFGNIATIFVMRRIKDNNSSQHVILMSLAASDLTLLYVSGLRQWLSYLFHVDVYEIHVIVCKLSWWLIYASSTSSSWLLTCVTVQRTMAVKWPHKMRMMCSVHRTWIVVASLVVLGCVLHVHFVYGMVLSKDSRCSFRSSRYKDFVTRAWTWVDLTVFTLAPSICLLVCDVILSLTLFRATSSAAITATNGKLSDIRDSHRATASRTTIMILALSCTFLVLTMPVCVYLIWDFYGFADSAPNSRLLATKRLAFAVTMLLWLTNSAINFLLYCFTGTRFRGEFFTWICCRSLQVHHKAGVTLYTI